MVAAREAGSVLVLVRVRLRNIKSREGREMGDAVSTVLPLSREYPKDGLPETLVCEIPGRRVKESSSICSDSRGIGTEEARVIR
jgi:hypothetical protein